MLNEHLSQIYPKWVMNPANNRPCIVQNEQHEETITGVKITPEIKPPEPVPVPVIVAPKAKNKFIVENSDPLS